MGTSQMLLAIGAMLLLSVIVLRMNTSMINTDDITTSSQMNIHAQEVANSVIAEAATKRFDEKSTYSISNGAVLTKIKDLGPDSGERDSTSKYFDDFDDYNGFKFKTAAGESVYVSVFYIEPDNIDSVSSNRTFYKKMVVKVKSPYKNSNGKQDIVTASKIYGYWPEMSGVTPKAPPKSSSGKSSSGKSSSGKSSSGKSSSGKSSSGKSSSGKGSSGKSSSGKSSSGKSSSGKSSSGNSHPKPPVYLR